MKERLARWLRAKADRLDPEWERVLPDGGKLSFTNEECCGVTLNVIDVGAPLYYRLSDLPRAVRESTAVHG